MPKIFEIWIITEGGIPIFSYSPESKLNPALISSFFSAIQSFALEISEKNTINSFSIGKFNYNFLWMSSYNLYFITKSDIKLKPKNIEKHLTQIAGLFLGIFNKELEEFEGDVSRFEPFKADFEIYLKDNFKTLKR